MHIIDFPTWLSYGGFACCLLFIGLGLLYLGRRKHKRTPPWAKTSTVQPPRRQPGVLAPFVYDAATPWGWLVYRNGNFLGQELALKRAIISIGREADNEVELDDDTISRYHAELAWENGQVYVTDNGSLNGVLLNGRRIRSSLPVNHGDVLDIGSHCFLLKLASKPVIPDDADDPLLKYVRRPVANQRDMGKPASGSHVADQPSAGSPSALSPQTSKPAAHPLDIAQQETSQITWQAEQMHSLCVLRSGNQAGHSFLLGRPKLIVGRGTECDIVINDVSVAPRHVQFTRQPTGDYVQDLASYAGSWVNGEPLRAPRLLRVGDVIALGRVYLEYVRVPDAQTARIPLAPHEPSPLNLPRG